METTRRTFLQMSLLAALNAYTVPQSHADTVNGPGNGAYSRLHELAPGSLALSGWSQLYLSRQAERLAFALPDVSWPFCDPYWAGRDSTGSWWRRLVHVRQRNTA